MKKELQIFKDQKGFTLVEIVMVILLLGILAAVGITSFTNFQTATREAAIKSDLQIMRNGIAAQFGNLQIHCGDDTSTWPAFLTVSNNDITNSSTGPHTPAGTCQATDIVNPGDRMFAANGIPPNPWGYAKGSTVYNCTSVAAGGTGGNPGPAAGACSPAAAVNCNNGAAYGAAGAVSTDDGWCYDPTTGKFWANSENNPTTNEATY